MENGKKTYRRKARNRRGRRRRRALWDILAIGMVLGVFCLVYFTQPEENTPLRETANLTAGEVHTPQPVEEEPEQGEPDATDTPTDSPAPAREPGDFSDTFPTESTGGSLYSYQSEDLRLAVDRVEEDGVTYFIADVWIRDIREFKTAFAKNRYGHQVCEMPTITAKENKALLAITGDYYSGKRQGLVIRNGELYRDSVVGDVCVLYVNGEMATYSAEEFDTNDVLEGNIWQAWEFGPALLKDGQAIDSFEGSTIAGRNPRTAIGYYEPGHYCLVNVDGRSMNNSRGMRLTELSRLFASLGCKTAYNLDGGRTSQMLWAGEVINQPYKGGRECSDIIYFGTYE